MVSTLPTGKYGDKFLEERSRRNERGLGAWLVGQRKRQFRCSGSGVLVETLEL